jgi:putative flavoprotein involved in K+ transport
LTPHDWAADAAGPMQSKLVGVSDLPSSADTVVIGAGQAGLAMSHELSQAGVDHLVLEARDRLGGSWLKRWDSFCLVTPNWAIRLPGGEYDGPDPDGYLPRDELVNHMDRYGRAIGAPIAFNARATRLEPFDDGGGARLRVETERGSVEARNVVLATGAFQQPKVPPAASGIPADVLQLHTDEYRNERELPEGGVLVIGSGQSGCQVAEELHDAGRQTYLSVSSCWRAPRRYRGRDTTWWLFQRGMRGAELGLKVDTVDDLPHPRMRFACNPHLSGTKGGHTINLRSLGASGVTLVGRFEGADDGRVRFADDLAANLQRADTFFDEYVRPELDEFIERAGMDAPPYEPDSIAWEPPARRELDLRAEDIGTVIWGTGYRFDFGWIPALRMDETGYPIHRRGVTEVPGLYLLGLPWLHTQASSLLVGVGQDARVLAPRMAA